MRVPGVVRRVASIALLLVVAACATEKPPNAFEQAFEDDTRPWQEIQTQLPRAPKDDDLVYFAVSGASQFHFAIDTTSLTIGTDGVFRYTLVAVSPQGARNISYEGIRCETQEKKIYAIGRPDGTWVRARNAAWSLIQDVSLNRQHAALLKEYFCPEGYPARDDAEIFGRLRVRIPATNY